MDWHIGQRVVCVRDNWKIFHPQQAANGKPIAGQVYTIRAFNLDPQMVGTVCGFFLDEIRNPVLHYEDGIYREMSFDQIGFRAVKTTDISIFTAMLKTAREFTKS